MQAVARPLACQVAQLREAVDHHPGRAKLVDPCPDLLDHLGELNLGRMEHGLLTCLAEDAAQVREVHDLDALERPAMRSGERGKLVERLGERHQERGLVTRHAGMEKLERQRRLARTCLAFQQIQASHRQSAHQDSVQAVDAGG